MEGDRERKKKVGALREWGLQVGCTILVDKSATLISVSYLPLLCDFHMYGGYCWGVATLAYMYQQIRVASCAQTH